MQDTVFCDSNGLFDDLELIIIEVTVLLERRQLVHFARYHLLGTDLQTLQPAIVRLRPAPTALFDEGLAQGLVLVARLQLRRYAATRGIDAPRRVQVGH